MTRTARKRRLPSSHYTLIHELMASTREPLPAQHIRHQLTRMHGGLRDMTHSAAPSKDSWRVLSDCVNLLETLVTEGTAPVRNAQGRTIASHWLDCDGDAIEVRDSSGLLQEAIAALAEAGERVLAQGQALRLSGTGLASVRAVLEDYSAAIAQLPARTMIRCHRLTEVRVRAALNAIQHLPDGVHVMAL